MANRYVAEKPIQVHETLRSASFRRADLRLHGVDHSGATFEGRVFLNNPKADEKTPKTPARGYAGSFHIFGHGGCFGDEGHCDVPEQRRPYDHRRPHPLTPADIAVTITDGLRTAMKKGPAVHVTIVPVIMSTTDKVDPNDVLKFNSLEIVTFQ